MQPSHGGMAWCPTKGHERETESKNDDAGLLSGRYSPPFCLRLSSRRPAMPSRQIQAPFICPFAAFTAGTSSSNGRMFGTGPKGVMEKGLIW